MGWEIFARFNAVSEMSLFWKNFSPFLPVLILRVVCGRQTISFGRISFLRYGKANMDTLIGIGIVAFIYSLVVSAFEENLKLFINVEQTYYDVAVSLSPLSL